jgi:hypothetical protein
MPYGGVKDSRLGREGLRWAIGDMTKTRIIVLAQPGCRRSAGAGSVQARGSWTL